MSKKNTVHNDPRQQTDLAARKEGAPKKKFNEKDIANIVPKTHNQNSVFESFFQGNNIAMLGSAGSGKSFIGMFLGLREVLLKNSQELIIVRSATPSKDMGFLPGTIDEKLEIFEEPYMAICDRLFPYSNSYANLKENGYLSFVSTSYLRGKTFDNAIVLIDEIQNLTHQETNTIMTRLGENTRVLICGDIKQSDLDRRKSLPWETFTNTLQEMPSLDVIYFDRHDIIRGGLTREWIEATEHTGLLEN